MSTPTDQRSQQALCALQEIQDGLRAKQQELLDGFIAYWTNFLQPLLCKLTDQTQLIEKAFDDCKTFLQTHATSPNHNVQNMMKQWYDILQTAVNEQSFVDVQIEFIDGSITNPVIIWKKVFYKLSFVPFQVIFLTHSVSSIVIRLNKEVQHRKGHEPHLIQWFFKQTQKQHSEISLPLTEEIQFEEFETMKDDNQCVQLFAIVHDPKLYTNINKMFSSLIPYFEKHLTHFMLQYIFNDSGGISDGAYGLICNMMQMMIMCESKTYENNSTFMQNLQNPNFNFNLMNLYRGTPLAYKNSESSKSKVISEEINASTQTKLSELCGALNTSRETKNKVLEWFDQYDDNERHPLVRKTDGIMSDIWEKNYMSSEALYDDCILMLWNVAGDALRRCRETTHVKQEGEPPFKKTRV